MLKLCLGAREGASSLAERTERGARTLPDRASRTAGGVQGRSCCGQMSSASAGPRDTDPPGAPGCGAEQCLCSHSPQSHPERPAKPQLLGATINSHRPNPRQSRGRELNTGLSSGQTLRPPPPPPTFPQSAGTIWGSDGAGNAPRLPPARPQNRGEMRARRRERAAPLQMRPRGPAPGGAAGEGRVPAMEPTGRAANPLPAPAPLTGGTCAPCP